MQSCGGDLIGERITLHKPLHLGDGHLAKTLAFKPDRAGDMGGQQHIRQIVKRRIGGQDLWLCHIDHGRDPPGNQFASQRRMIDQTAACGIDQRAAVAQQRQPPRINHVARRVECRGMQRQRIGPANHVIQRHVADTQRRCFCHRKIGIMHQHRQIERPQQVYHPPTYARQADDSDGLVPVSNRFVRQLFWMGLIALAPVQILKAEDVPNFVKVISIADAAQNDYNLAPSRYVNVSEQEEYRPIPEVLKELRVLEKDAGKLDADLEKTFRQMGFEP